MAYWLFYDLLDGGDGGDDRPVTPHPPLTHDAVGLAPGIGVNCVGSALLSSMHIQRLGGGDGISTASLRPADSSTALCRWHVGRHHAPAVGREKLGSIAARAGDVAHTATLHATLIAVSVTAASPQATAQD